MRLALVTTARVEGCAVAQYAGELAAALRALIDVELFVERDRAGIEFGGARTKPCDELLPREFDSVLFEVADDARVAFVAPMIRGIGGAVELHDWNLAHFAQGAFPQLARTGWRSTWSAVREGGLAQALEWRRRGASDSALPPLNRSVVRFADSFITHGATLAHAIAEERNAPTPIGVVDPDGEDVSGAERARQACAGRWERVAARYVELLQRFPRPRASRRTLIAMRLAELRREAKG